MLRSIKSSLYRKYLWEHRELSKKIWEIKHLDGVNQIQL